MQEINSPRVVAGNGRYFYGEPIMVGNSEYYIQHSISSCPKIRTGTKRGWIKIQNDANYFCPICMNNDLIDTFNSRYFPDKGK